MIFYDNYIIIIILVNYKLLFYIFISFKSNKEKYLQFIFVCYGTI